MTEIYRQGDVAIIKVAELEAGEPADGLLAIGESSGHSHRVRNAKVTKTKKGKQLEVKKKAVIEHEEHGPIELKKGKYEVRLQREYSPMGMQRVKD